MKRIVIFCLLASVILYALTVRTVKAASFDCTKASTPVEKLICNIPKLSELDDRLAAQYKNAANVSLDKEALKSEQRRWLKELRNACKDEACLVRVYEERIAALSGIQTLSFVTSVWTGEWISTCGNQFRGATLEIMPHGATLLEFKISADSGGNLGEIEGEIELHGNQAVFVAEKDESYERQCRVELTLVGGEISLKSSDCSAPYFGIGADECLDSKYAKGFKRKTSTLAEYGFLTSEEEERKFKALVGNDYESFLHSAQLVQDTEDIDNVGATVRAAGVRGLFTYLECIVMQDREGKFMAALLDRKAPEGSDTVRYFTNNPSYARTLPKTIDKWRERFQELPVVMAAVPELAPAPASNPQPPPASVSAPVPAVAPRPIPVESSLKVKGLFIGMDIKSVSAILKQKLPEGQGFEVIDAIADRLQVLILHGVEGVVGAVQARPEGDVVGIVIGGSALDTLFSASGMEASDFVQEFINAYHIPEMKVGDDMKSWNYSSPEGYKIGITTTKILSILKIPSASERRKAFD